MDGQEVSITTTPTRDTSPKRVNIVNTDTECQKKLFARGLKASILSILDIGDAGNNSTTIYRTPRPPPCLMTSTLSVKYRTSAQCCCASLRPPLRRPMQACPATCPTRVVAAAHGFTPKLKNCRRRAPVPHALHLHQGCRRICLQRPQSDRQGRKSADEDAERTPDFVELPTTGESMREGVTVV
jgi:hypothetical protein